MSISDQTGKEVIHVTRPTSLCMGICCSCFYPRCTTEMNVAVDGEPVGTIRERATWWYPVYHRFDTLGQYTMKIRGPACQLACCQDVTFTVTTNEGNDVATISKKWMGCFKETMTDADNFVIDFLTNLTVEEKSMILASTFLIDLMYYEYK